MSHFFRLNGLSSFLERCIDRLINPQPHLIKSMKRQLRSMEYSLCLHRPIFYPTSSIQQCAYRPLSAEKGMQDLKRLHLSTPHHRNFRTKGDATNGWSRSLHQPSPSCPTDKWQMAFQILQLCRGFDYRTPRQASSLSHTHMVFILILGRNYGSP